jgi:hypothetical protein
MTKNLLKRVIHKAKNFATKQDRGSIVEYILIMSIIAVGTIVWLQVTKRQLGEKMEYSSNMVRHSW